MIYFYPIIISYGTGSNYSHNPTSLAECSIILGKTQEELTVKKGDAMAFCGVLGFAMVIFYAVQQVMPREKLGVLSKCWESGRNETLKMIVLQVFVGRIGAVWGSAAWSFSLMCR